MCRAGRVDELHPLRGPGPCTSRHAQLGLRALCVRAPHVRIQVRFSPLHRFLELGGDVNPIFFGMPRFFGIDVVRSLLLHGMGHVASRPEMEVRMRIARDGYLADLIASKGNGLVKVVTGIRRSGKSYLLEELFCEHLRDSGIPDGNIVFVALDDRRNRSLRDPDEMLAFLDSAVAAAPNPDAGVFVIIDEVQMLREFTDVLTSLLHRRGVDVFVTGSNSRFLATDVVTEFRGRADQHRIHPLSFKEYFSAVGGDAERAFADYLVWGGMPLALSFDSDERRAAYLADLLDEVYLADVVERNGLHDAEGLGELACVLASSVGSLTNPTRIANTFASRKGASLSDKTIEKYISCLEDAFLISRARRFDVKGRRYISSPSKWYFEDTGLRNARLGFRQIDEGHLLENVIFNELRRRGASVDVGVVESWGRASSGKTRRTSLEIDFVVNRGSMRCYVQSAASLADAATREREKRPLSLVGDNFRKLVVCADSLPPHSDDDGVQTIGVIDFLLDEDSLDRYAGV